MSSKSVNTQFEFGSLTDENQFLVREHLESFVTLGSRQFSTRFVSQVFNELVDGSTTEPWNPDDDREPMPLDGIMVRSRAALGLEPYTGLGNSVYIRSLRNFYCAQYAVQVASLVETFTKNEWQRKEMNAGQAGAFVVTQYLAIQLET